MTERLARAVRAVLADAIAARVAPGGVIAVGSSAGLACTAALGRVTYAAHAAEVTRGTVYDLASLTKVIATTTLTLRASAAGVLPLATRVAARLEGFAMRDAITVLDLLEHAAGFPAHRNYYRAVAGSAGYLARLAAEPAVYPARTTHVYTDLGFILLGLLLEQAAAAPLATQFAGFVNDVLPGAEMAFGVRPAWRARVAPAGVDPWRGRVVAGSVHDSNAAALGGAAGHAGLFGTAEAVSAFARWWLGLTRGATAISYGIPPPSPHAPSPAAMCPAVRAGSAGTP